MRKQLLAVLLPLLILALIASAETQSTSTGADTRATVQKVDVMHADDGISVEITAQRTGDAQAQYLGLAGSCAGDSAQHRGSHRPEPHQRGQRRREGRAHRHRWPRASDHQRRDRPGAGVPIRTASGRRQQNHCQAAPRRGEGQHEAATPAPAKLQTTASTVAPASVKTAVAVSKPAPAAASPVAAPAAVKPAIRPRSRLLPRPTLSSWSRRTSRRVRTDKATADETDPSDRRPGAAAKFVDKPEGNLLPTPSAAMQPQAAQAAATQPSNRR